LTRQSLGTKKSPCSKHIINTEKFLGTLGHKMKKFPIEFHLGPSKKMENVFELNKGWGIFAGVTVYF